MVGNKYEISGNIYEVIDEDDIRIWLQDVNSDYYTFYYKNHFNALLDAGDITFI